YRRSALKTVGAEIFIRKISLPGVGHGLAAGRELLTPSELDAVQSAARGKFPFGFGWQFLAGPLGVGLGIAIGNMNDWVIVEPADRAARAVWPAPVRAELEFPPL